MPSEGNIPAKTLSRDFLSTIVNSIADPVFVKDEAHCWVFLNDACLAFMKKTAEELIGKTDYDFFPKEESDVFWEKDNEVFQTGQGNINEEFFTDAAGITHTIVTKKNLYLSPDGKRYIVGIIRDVTEQRDKEREIARLNTELAKQYTVTKLALVSTESKLQRISDSNIVGIIFWHIDGKLLDANQAFLDMVGYTFGDLKAGLVDWRQMTPPEYNPQDEAAVKSLLETGAHQPVEKQYITKAGGRVDIIVASAFLDDDRQQGVGVVVDITTRKQSERQMEIAQRELKLYADKLEQSNKELENFATVASHDLQAPLRKVQIFSDHLQHIAHDNLDAEALADIERIQASTGRMQVLINDLLALSRVTRLGQPFQIISLNEIVQDVLDDLKMEIQEVDGEVMVDDLCVIEADKTQMHQLFQNLIQNALKFHRDDVPPRIQIAAKPTQDGYYFISVKDNGIGIRNEYSQRIFELFQRLHGMNEYPGTGVGLTICKKIVERHNGTISAEGVPDQGSTFYINLPIHQV